MKDDNGLFYYPFPQNKRVRMYVDQIEGDICFRLWNQDDPEMWEDHGWVPHAAVKQAAEMYSGDKFNPSQAYDLDVARELLKGEGKI